MQLSTPLVLRLKTFKVMNANKDQRTNYRSTPGLIKPKNITKQMLDSLNHARDFKAI